MADRPELILVLGGARSGKSTFAEALAAERAAARAALRLAAGRHSPPPSDPRSASSVAGAASAAAPAAGGDAPRSDPAVVDAAGADSPPSGAGRVTYLATAQALDDEMRQRIARHQSDRAQNWTTVEAPLAVPEAVRSHAATTDAFLLDCVTFWVTNLLFGAGDLGEQVPEGLGDFSREFIAPEAERAASRRVADALDDLLAALAETGAVVVAVSNEVGLGLVPEYPLGRLYRDEQGRANHRLAAVATEAYLLVAGLPLDLKALAGPSSPAAFTPPLSSSSPPSFPLSSPPEEEPSP